MKNKKKEIILITGGFGYLGTFITNLLLKKNFKVVVVDNLINGKKFNKKNLFFIKKDFSSKFVSNYIKKKKIKKIVHLAAYIDAEESTRLPRKYFRNNVIELEKFLVNIKNNKIEKFIFASSAAVYGNSKNKIDEKFVTKPISPYGLSKLQGEKIVSFFSRKYNFSSYQIRFFNIAGADFKIGCGPLNYSYKHIFNILLRSKKFFINGINYDTFDGTCIRDFVNVSDVSDIILKILKKKEHKKGCKTFNCGSGIGTSVKSVVKAYKEKIDNNLLIYNGKRRKGDPVSIVADNQKIKKFTNIKFKKSNLGTIIQEYNDWKKNISPK